MEYSGLTSQQASQLLKETGYNEITQKKNSPLKKFLKWFVSPIALMLFIAALISLFSGKTFDFYFILALMVLNAGIGFWQENKADNAIEKLNQRLSSQVKVLRDGKWQMIESRLLVKGDLIEMGVGDIIPADGEIIEAKNLSLNESALTGESLPKEKKINDTTYSGSFVSTGMAKIKITATGKDTYFGKTLFSIERGGKKSALEQDILRISKFLSILSAIAVVLLTTVFLFQKANFAELITLDLSLVIAGIPISLPTVMTLIIEFGVLNLASKEVIVRRLSALEDLADVNLLLTDKTGTLTKNEITVQHIVSFEGKEEVGVLKYAFLAASLDGEDTINKSVLKKADEDKVSVPEYKRLDFIPADSDRKRSWVLVETGGQKLSVSVGAPQVIEGLCNIDSKTKVLFDKSVEDFAQKGYRSLAVAVKENSSDEKGMRLVGLMALSDTLREDAKSVIDFMKQNGIKVIMLTGDNKLIGQEIARELDLGEGKVVSREELEKLGWENVKKETFSEVGVFAQILPDDKYKLAKLAKKYFVVAVNGDGVNDLPAIQEASVGMAVKNAVDALKSTADIVLLSNGISVIRDAVVESRKIFARLYSYSMYRISESLRLIITITFLGIVYRLYPLTPIQLILLAVLNDIPIISLAFDRVKIASRPTSIKVKERFVLSSMFGMTGVFQSLILFIALVHFTSLTLPQIQTIYFLKLTVSGHMLIYVARTKERWFKFLPAKQVIVATGLTQIIATILAVSGTFMPSGISLGWAIFVWVWAFLWMQVSEVMKDINNSILKNKEERTEFSVAV